MSVCSPVGCQRSTIECLCFDIAFILTHYIDHTYYKRGYASVLRCLSKREPLFFENAQAHREGPTRNEVPNRGIGLTKPLLTRNELAGRWRCSIETLKRREKSGVLNGMRFSGRMVRYKLDEVLQIERQASCKWEAGTC